ncbi:hypothetical protein BC832DRAFT_558482 [Gaertneriomyces semiglobifer]|nr:hypothetical protein BC832DRAFT_569558 [Gaertneriomyces semiglobifer]KAI9004078.1 hypothetical protein BC832DRAFT_558482 [Gaertneriomyces semiglobifer]
MAVGSPSTEDPVWRQLVTADLPSPRTGHTLSYHARTKECILFGGASHEEGFLNQIHILNIASRQWRKATKAKSDSNCMSAPPRYEHVAAIVRRHGVECLLIAFGAGEDGLRDDVWAMDLDTYHWTLFNTKGQTPHARTLHSAGHVVVRNQNAAINGAEESHRIYVFGGGLAEDRPVDDRSMYCLDVNTLLWIRVSLGKEEPTPPARLGHSLTAVNDQIYCFGGLAGDRFFKDIWRFDTVRNTWTEIKVSGDIPSGRSGHTAVAKGKLIYIYGGLTKHPRPKALDELYAFDTESAKWTCLSAAAEPPGPPGALIDHDACLVPDQSSLLSSDIETTVAQKSSMVVFGGMDLSGIYNRLYQLDL